MEIPSPVYPKRTGNKPPFLNLLAIAILIVISFLAGVNYQKTITYQKPEVPGADFGIVWETWAKLQKYYLRELDYKKMIYGAASGVVDALGDPHTSFLDPKSSEILETDISGEFEGVGMEIVVKDKILTVVAPIDGTPAQKAGIKANDKILKINGTSTEGMTSDQAVKLIRGKGGTKVNLTIYRENSDPKIKEYEITRAKIVVPAVKLEFKTGKNNEPIAYLKISQFTSHLLDEFNKAAMAIDSKEGCNKIIIDVRNNPGGLLDQVIAMSRFFLKNGDTIVIEGKGKQSEEQVYKNFSDGPFNKHKVIVLINEGSASASEILAACLKENMNAVLIGQKTFGKGSVQYPLKLSDGSMLKVTVAEWLTPKGNHIDGVGIKPDVEVEIKEEDVKAEKDPQLDKALEIIQNP